MKTLDVINGQGHRFKIVLITDGEPVVEFYSLGSNREESARLQGVHGPNGSFVARFNISAIDDLMDSDDLALRFSENMYRDGYFVEGWVVRMAVNLVKWA